MIRVLRTFLGFLYKKKLLATIFVFMVVLAAIVSSVQPYFYKLFVDAAPTLDYDLLLKILLLYVGVRFVELIIQSTMFYLGDILYTNGATVARETVFSHLHDLDFAFHADKSSGSLISAMKRGDSSFWNVYFAIHYRLISVAVSFLVMLYFFNTLDVRIFLITLISFFVSMVITWIFIKVNIRKRNEVNRQDDRISSVVVDNMINFETVKLFAKEKWEKTRLVLINKDWKEAVSTFVFTFRTLDLTMGTVVNISIFLLLLFAAKMTISGDFSVGDFVLVIGFSATFYPKLWELVWGFRDLAKSYSDIEKYFGVLDFEVKVKDTAKPKKIKEIKGEIEYKDVNFAYEAKQEEAVKKINLKIREGQSVALVGRSGAGKTTLVKLLMRFYDVDKGKITIDGVNLRDLRKSDLRSYMGVVPQEPVLFNNSLEYNIAYGKDKVTKKEIVAAAKLARIHDFIETLPEKYKTKVGERGIKLSGGQKQRVAIARMILSDPEIIIFDEATSQLDSESERLIQEAFWKASENKTTIIIAHRLSTVMRADKIVVMEEGKIVETGSHKELVNKKDSLYKHFWELQLN